MKPKFAVLPLIAVMVADVQTKDWRSRPGSAPEYRTLDGIQIEGIEDLVRLVHSVA